MENWIPTQPEIRFATRMRGSAHGEDRMHGKPIGEALFRERKTDVIMTDAMETHSDVDHGITLRSP